jgi:hypothetical protein
MMNNKNPETRIIRLAEVQNWVIFIEKSVILFTSGLKNQRIIKDRSRARTANRTVSNINCNIRFSREAP